MTCAHLDNLTAVEPTTTEGCEDCLRIDGTWVHLRLCMDCGHVGCCDDSPNRHASAHHVATDHAVIQSFEPGETWAYCYPHETATEDVGGQLARSY